MVKTLPLGPVLWTGSRYIDVMNPDPDDLDMIEIMKALSRIRRYNGLGTRLPWTVGQHSLLAHRFALDDGVTEAKALLTILLHDAPEGFVGDLVQPVKVTCPDYKAREGVFWKAIAERWSLPLVMPEIVHHYDRVALASEKADLLSPKAGVWPNLPDAREIPTDLFAASDVLVWFMLMETVQQYVPAHLLTARSRSN